MSSNMLTPDELNQKFKRFKELGSEIFDEQDRIMTFLQNMIEGSEEEFQTTLSHLVASLNTFDDKVREFGNIHLAVVDCGIFDDMFLALLAVKVSTAYDQIEQIKNALAEDGCIEFVQKTPESKV